MKKLLLSFLIIGPVLILITLLTTKDYPTVTRADKIPVTAIKMTPGLDPTPPILHSRDFKTPVPVPGLINTLGAEDSPFITADNNRLFFFFTPDVTVPVEKQLLDNVTGIWVSKKDGNGWSEPERVWLQKPGKLALDGCEFVLDQTLWFCSAREGYEGIRWFTAEEKNGIWSNWKEAVFDQTLEVGELAFSPDGNEMYFGSKRTGGQGENDLWMSKKIDGKWMAPINLTAVNSTADDTRPFVTFDGQELWFTRWYKGTPALFRSKKIAGEWQAPELIISQFAGEPTLDREGNVYFVHHYFKNGKMLEADIYVANRN